MRYKFRCFGLFQSGITYPIAILASCGNLGLQSVADRKTRSGCGAVCVTCPIPPASVCTTSIFEFSCIHRSFVSEHPRKRLIGNGFCGAQGVPVNHKHPRHKQEGAPFLRFREVGLLGFWWCVVLGLGSRFPSEWGASALAFNWLVVSMILLPGVCLALMTWRGDPPTLL